MLLCMLALALVLSPETAMTHESSESSEPSEPGELTHWRNAPEPVPEPPAEPAKVPSDGAGLITLGSILLGTGASVGVTSVGLTVANDRDTRNLREIGGIASAVGLGGGAVLLTLGLVVRQQFRRSAAGNIADAPRIGSGMLFGGLGLLVGGTAATAQAIGDITILVCTGSLGCQQRRPIGAPIQLGLALASMAVGTGLVVGGVKRRLGYKQWALQRAQLQPSFGIGPTSFTLALAGRF
jgi:hypothetical protein